MRNLIIKREKSFVGCAGKYKVYMVDQSSADLKIKKEPCRKLGVLKNGEEAVFQIPNEEVKIYIIAGSASKSYCNEMVILPAGQDDIYLSGKAKYNPFKGNPYRLSGPVSEETKKNRKGSNKIATFVMLGALIFGFVVGFINGLSSDEKLLEPETFSVDNMQITLIQEFVEVPYDDFDAAYQTTDMLVLVVKESKPIAEGYEDLTLEEYAELLITGQENSGLVCSDLKNENGLCYFEYQATIDEETYYYKDYAYESNDAFWNITFICYNEDALVANTNSISEWASSVTFTESV